MDRLLGGGFPLGGLSEVTAASCRASASSSCRASASSSCRASASSSCRASASSSCRTTLALSLLAATTARGELAAWVDGADAFDPASAERLGVDLDRMLWVRARGWPEASRATERLLQTEGFPLVVLDWTASRETPRSVSWIRLSRLATATRKALVLLSTNRLAGPHAELVLEMQPARARFRGTPALLEALEARVVLVRNRAAPVDPSASFPVELEAHSEPRPSPSVSAPAPPASPSVSPPAPPASPSVSPPAPPPPHESAA